MVFLTLLVLPLFIWGVRLEVNTALQDEKISTLQKELDERRKILQTMSKAVDLHERHHNLGMYFIEKQKQLESTLHEIAQVHGQQDR